jgi:subtilisin family serine protease
MGKLAAVLAATALLAIGSPASATTQPNPPSWGLDRIDQLAPTLDNAYRYPSTASNVNVYVIDGGIRRSHQTFGGRAQVGYDAVTPGGPADDCTDHGTHVAGTIGGSQYGVAKGVRLYSVRVVDCNGYVNNQAVVNGVNWVTQNAKKPAVAMVAYLDARNDAIDDAVRQSIKSGVTYVVSAGNLSGYACGTGSSGLSPARVEEAITVSATTTSDTREVNSGFGPCVDLFAPGKDIISAGNASDTATKIMSGTDTAAAHVAGAAALYLSANPTATPQQVRDELVDNAISDKVVDPAGSSNKLLFTPCVAKKAATQVPIPDRSTAKSSVTISSADCAPTTVARVSVNITHPYRGELKIDLVAPNGTVRTLKPVKLTDANADVDATYLVDIPAAQLLGTWTLQVTDTMTGSTGTINKWKMLA